MTWSDTALRRFHRRVVALFSLTLSLSLTIASPDAVLAQDRGGDPWELAPDELREQGWEFADEDVQPGSVLAGLLAASVGFPVRGIGHTLIGDRPTAWRLVALEAAGLALVGTGILTRQLASDSRVAEESATVLATAGASLFLSSWAADVVGGFRGTAVAPSHRIRQPDGLALHVAYTRLFGQGLDTRDVAVLGVPFRTERVIVHPEAQIAANLNYRRFGVELGWRIPLTATGQSEMVLIATGADEYMSDDGSGRTSMGGDVEFVLAFGDLLPHLGGLRWTHRIGVRTDFWFYEAADTGRFSGDELHWRVPTSFEFGVVASPALRLDLGYSSDTDALLGRMRRHIGSVYGRATLLPARRLGVELKGEQGEAFRIWMGLRFYITGARDEQSTVGSGRGE